MSEDVDIDSPEARLQMVRLVLLAIVSGNANPVALAKAGLDLADLTDAQRAEMRGEAITAHSIAQTDWRWYSGSNDEWYSNGPFPTREEAFQALEGSAGYLIEARPADPVHFSAARLIEEQYLEGNDSFDDDHGEPDRRGESAAIVAADAELQVRLDHWCERYAHTFELGNLFGATRNGERVEACTWPGIAIVETHSTTPVPCPVAAADSTDGAQ